MTPGNLFPRDFGHAYPVIVRGQGIRLWDADGNEYLDASSGANSVVSVGLGRREVADAIHEQILKLSYVHDGEFHNGPAHELAAKVTAMAGGSFARSVFFSGGSEAIESAIKLAHNYHVLNGESQRHVVISRKRSFHGATLFAGAIGDITGRKTIYQGYAPTQTAKIPAAYCYRCPLGLQYPGCQLACAQELERSILELGPQNVSAFVAEPVVGAAAPGLIPPAGYYETIREICDRYGVLWIADEIITGFGRTGRNFGYQHWNAQPDVLVVAKALSGGYIPVSGLIISARVTRPFEEQRARFVHGLTYQNHPVGCAAALAVLAIIEREHLVENAAAQGAYLESRLREIADRLPIVGEVRGKGLLWGMELVGDRGTKAPFEKSHGITRRVHERALRNGLVIYQGGGSVYSSDEIVISPPLVVTPNDVDEIVDRLTKALVDIQSEVLPTSAVAERTALSG